MFPSVLLAGTQGLTRLQLGGRREPGTAEPQTACPAL